MSDGKGGTVEPRGGDGGGSSPAPRACCWAGGPAGARAAQRQQQFYHDSRGKCCRKLLRHNGYPNKVLLFPEEGWARSASSSYWTLQPSWWSRTRCKVVEIAGTRRHSTWAKMVDNGTGAIYIMGSFKRMQIDPDFKLYLTSNVTSSDFNMGYSMTGTLERGCKKTNTFQMTHFAVIRRKDFETGRDQKT